MGIVKDFEEVLRTLPEFYEKDIKETDYPRGEFPFVEELDPRVFDNFETLTTEISEIPEDLIVRASDALSEHERLAIAGGLSHQGLDIIAFYKSYRLIDRRPFVGRWGIFYVGAGLGFLKFLIEKELGFPDRAARAAFLLVREHELYHCSFDQAVLAVEGVAKEHLYLPNLAAFERCRSQNPEEAVANLAAWIKSRELDLLQGSGRRALRHGIPNLSKFATSFMSSQPGAYSRFHEPRRYLLSELAACVLAGDRYRGAELARWSRWFEPFPIRGPSSEIPQHWIDGVNLARLLSPAVFLPAVRKVDESTDFQKDVSKLGHQEMWANTKRRLLEFPGYSTLHFRKWPPEPPLWSVNVGSDSGFRAHLRPLGDGGWEGVHYGNHKKMGHG